MRGSRTKAMFESHYFVSYDIIDEGVGDSVRRWTEISADAG